MPDRCRQGVFELYADGNLVGEGEWWEPAKDTYRFKVESHVKTFAVKINGGNEARMGLLGMFGDKLVTSSMLRHKYG